MRVKRIILLLAGTLSTTAISYPSSIRAAEIKLLAATVTEMVLRETGAEFERKTGHKINMKSHLQNCWFTQNFSF